MWLSNYILNQGGAPAILEGLFADRPAAGVIGRIYVSTDTFAIYRDNGVGWDLIAGPGTGTVTGNGVSLQLALWDGASTLKGDTGITYNNTTKAITAGAFIVTGGTSAQFQKADGSLDNTVYVNTSTTQTISGLKTFNNFLTINAGLSSFGTVGTPLYTEATSGIALNAVATNGNGSIVVNNSTINPTSIFQQLGSYRITEYKNNSGLLSYINNSGQFVIVGGTSTQLLAADGSTVATSSFAPATGGSYLPLGGGNLTGVVNSTSRLNLNGATDNILYQLNVIGSGRFTNTIFISGAGIDSSGVLLLNGSGRAGNYQDAVRVTNTSGDMLLTVEGSSGGGRYTGSSSYATVLGTATATDLQLGTNDIVRVTITPTGITNVLSRLNINGATDNSLFALNVNGTVNGSSPSFTGNTYTVTGNLSQQFYHVFTGAVGQTLTAPTPSGNNSQYLIVNNSANVLTVAAFSGTNIITTIGTTAATITLAANARTLLVADGNNKYYQAF